MSGKMVAVGGLEDLSTLQGGVFQVAVANEDLVRFDADSPLRGVRWAEAELVMLEARLSPRERQVFELYHRGASVRQIARYLRLESTTVQVYMARARAKCARQDIGIISDMIEHCGWSTVRDYLAEREEAAWDRKRGSA